MGGVEVPQATRGVGSGQYPLPTGGKDLMRGMCPLAGKFLVFFVENTLF